MSSSYKQNTGKFKRGNTMILFLNPQMNFFYLHSLVFRPWVYWKGLTNSAYSVCPSLGTQNLLASFLDVVQEVRGL